MDSRSFVVEVAGARLDQLVSQHYDDLSRTTVQRLLREGRVLVNGASAKPSYRAEPGDTISLEVPTAEQRELTAERLPLEIIYEDAHLLVINKAAGVVVHPAPGHNGGTLVNALLAHRPDVVAADADPTQPGVVHRLDRDTSGLLLMACTRAAQDGLRAQFKARTVDKRYLTLVWGRPQPDHAAVEAPIGRDPANRLRRAVLPEADGGRYALSEYTVLEALPEDLTLLEVRLHTGRTHQIRVHLASIGFPVAGDAVYGRRRGGRLSLPGLGGRQALPRQMLHAWRLSLAHPITGAPLSFEAPVPSDFERLLTALRAARR
jgi:23S rRNA pseudouridine1911/1915/1917 synthase